MYFFANVTDQNNNDCLDNVTDIIDARTPGRWSQHDISNNSETDDIVLTTDFSPDDQTSIGLSSPRGGYLFGDLYLHPHWMHYRDVIDDPPSWFLNLVGVYMIAICLVGIIGNITVIAVFLKTAMLRTSSNYFIINLAFSDATFSLINGFPLMSVACFSRKWMWGQTACEWYAFIAGVCGMNSIGTMMLIAIDRYFTISRPFKTLYKATPKRSILGIISIWIWAFIWTCPPMFGWSRYIGEGFQVSCSFDYLTRSPANIAFNYCLIGFGFLLPVAVISSCYIGVVSYVSRQSAIITRSIEATSMTRGGDTIQQERQDHVRQGQEIKRAKNVAIMISLFILSWLPYAVITLLGINGFTGVVTPYSTEIPVMLAKASAIWNPIVYAFTNPRYQLVLQKICLVRKLLRRRTDVRNIQTQPHRRPSQLPVDEGHTIRLSSVGLSPNIVIFSSTR